MNKILCFLFLFPIMLLSQSTYYIDATNGNDSNDGLSEITAWKTINKVSNQTFNAGDEILFKRNEIWRGNRLSIENVVGTSSSNVTYSDYGNGDKPIISSVETHAHNWTYTSNNIWKATNPPAEHPERLLIDNEEKLRANILSELDGVNYYWFYDNNTNDLYVHAIENPINKSISYSIDFPLIIGEANNITINNLDFQGGWTAIYITTLSSNIKLQNLNIGKYSREGIIVSTDSTTPTDFPTNLHIENCNFDAFFNFDYSSASIYQDSFDRGCSDGIRTEVLINGIIRNCFFKNWGHASINIDGVHVANIKIDTNYLTSPDICYGGRIGVDDANHVEVYNNQIINTSVQSQLNGQSNHYHHNIFSNTTDTHLVPIIIDAGIELQGYSHSNVINNIYENNIILNTEGPAIRISGNNEFDVYNNTFRNNIVYNCGTTINGKSVVVEQNEFGTTHDNSFKNNLIYNSNTTQTCDFRNNIIDVSSFNTFSENGYQIANNISDNPQLIDIDNGDYHLVITSPCINSGTNTLSVFDFEGNNLPYTTTAPDIGIYEYQGVLSIVEKDSQKEIVLFPNPTNDFLQINGIQIDKIKQIYVTDISGKIVLKEIEINKSIPITSLSKGVYFIHIKIEDKLITKKIVLK